MKQSEIRQLMKKEFMLGVEQKVFLFDQSSSQEHLKSAIDFAYQLSEPGFWPKLISYRLAHLMMRDAQTETEFKTILELLDVECAKRFPHLDFITGILNIAALYRYSQITKKNFDDQIEGNISHLSTLLSSRDLNSRIANIEQYPLHDLHFNMLELVAYFTGSSGNKYDLLPESSRVMHNQRGQSSWQIVLPDGEADGLYYDRDLAGSEIDSLMSDSHSASLVILGPENEFSFYYRGVPISGLEVHHAQMISNLVSSGGASTAEALSSRSDKARRTDIQDVNKATVADLISYDSRTHLWKLRLDEKIYVMRFRI